MTPSHPINLIPDVSRQTARDSLCGICHESVDLEFDQRLNPLGDSYTLECDTAHRFHLWCIKKHILDSRTTPYCPTCQHSIKESNANELCNLKERKVEVIRPERPTTQVRGSGVTGFQDEFSLFMIQFCIVTESSDYADILEKSPRNIPSRYSTRFDEESIRLHHTKNIS